MTTLPRLALTFLALLVTVGCSASRHAQSLEEEAPLTIGVYDGRALAVAFAASDLFAEELGALQQRHAAAEAAGDLEAARALEAQGRDRQERLHGQAFFGEPVDEILALVPEKVAALLERNRLERLERVNLERPRGSRTLDLTDQLIALFDPSPETLERIAELREAPFLSPG